MIWHLYLYQNVYCMNKLLSLRGEGINRVYPSLSTVVCYLRYNIGGFLARVSYYASRHHYIMSQVGNRMVACGHHQNATCYNFSTYIICRI